MEHQDCKIQHVLSSIRSFVSNKAGRSSKLDLRPDIRVRALKGPFIKIEDHSPKYRPEFLEMKTFPYIDFNTTTGSPFDTWFEENRGNSKL